MTAPSIQNATQLLLAWSDGDPMALDKLTPLVYRELHRLAERYMRREPAGHTLQATALVNEVYLKLIDQSSVRWHNRAHFFGVAAQIMRHILVDFARSRRNQKRGGDLRRVSFDEALLVFNERGADLAALDDALSALESIDLRKSQVVELRFFGGLSVEETAEVLKISSDTVMRDWRLAKMWLLHELETERGHGKA